jgi:GLPGLI family protein
MRTILITLIAIVGLQAKAQVAFITGGKIEFEKKLNQHQTIKSTNDPDEQQSSWQEEYLKQIPKSVTDIFVLEFNEHKSVYKLAAPTDQKYMWSAKPSEDDVLVQDFEKKEMTVQRDVFETTYLIKDSLRNLSWRITDETREIAGFTCRKAVTKICDSVVVVAFYTDQIVVSSGPEAMGGLPGMILGLAVPRLYTTWFATKVILNDYTDQQLTPKQKGTAANWKNLHVTLNKALKEWGKWGNRFLWSLLL